MAARRLAVVGAGWAGLAAAVEATSRGWQVTLFDMARQPGGRARSAPHGELLLDNGQHILIGAYRDTLALMRCVGADPQHALLRRPLALVGPDGQGLRLPPGPAVPALLRGVLAWRAVPLADRLRFLALALRWRLAGFRCPPDWTVARLACDCPRSVYQALLEPLCVAALNTPAETASAAVLLTVLRDALFAGPGAADLLLPRRPLDELLPVPALAWLQARGAAWRPGQRVQALRPTAGGWQVDDEPFDHAVLACSAAEAARLLAGHAPAWSAQAAAFAYQPIVTLWLRSPGTRWSDAMLAFSGPAQPAQFGFALEQLGGSPGLFALVISGAADWVARGAQATAAAVLAQWQGHFAAPAEVLAQRTEKRATFACTPGLPRPAMQPLPGITVAGDYIEGPYPATLEGAVRSGLRAVP